MSRLGASTQPSSTSLVFLGAASTSRRAPQVRIARHLSVLDVMIRSIHESRVVGTRLNFLDG